MSTAIAVLPVSCTPSHPGRRPGHPRSTASQLPSLSHDGILGIYFAQINATPLLTRDEEIVLARRMACGDQDARDHMIRANLRLVVKIARDFMGRGLSLEDLISFGNLGLCQGADGFDLSYGTRFSTYATHWIKQGIRAALVNDGFGCVTRLPGHINTMLSKRKQIVDQWTNDPSRYGYTINDDDVWATLGLTDRQVSLAEDALHMRSMARHDEVGDVNLETPDSLEKMVADDSEPFDVTLMDADERRHDCDMVLDRLHELVADDAIHPWTIEVLTMRFGLDGKKKRTLTVAARHFGITREAVRRIERRAIARLKEEFMGCLA